MKRFITVLVFTFFLSAVALVAQQSQAPPKPPKQKQTEPAQSAEKKQTANSGANSSIGGELAEASKAAAGEEEDETAGFKQSSAVLWVAKVTGLQAKTAYWGLVALNFVVIAVLIGFIWKAKIPVMFRSRTAAIRKGMEEAQKASADASRRLGEIEQRLAKLDAEIASMRAAAEADAAAEEARIRALAEEDKRKVVEMAEQEITAAARSARHELKAYAAELSVSLAERRIQVDAKTDEALVRSFVSQLGEPDGRKENR